MANDGKKSEKAKVSPESKSMIKESIKKNKKLLQELSKY